MMHCRPVITFTCALRHSLKSRRHAMLSLDVGPARKTSQISFASAIHQAVQPMLGISMPKIRAARRNSRQIFILYLRVRLPLCPQSINRDGKPRRISLTFLCSPAFPQVCFAFAVVVGFCWNLPKARRAVGDLVACNLFFNSSAYSFPLR